MYRLKGKTIKRQKTLRVNTLVVVSCSVFMGLICSLLIVEYWRFKSLSEQMLECKEEYRTYVMALRKVLDDYNTAKEQVKLLEEAVSEEKKKRIEWRLSGRAMFPENATVYSSSQWYENDEQMNHMLNRECEYLKEHSIAYAQHMGRNDVVQWMTTIHFWDDYDQQLSHDYTVRNKPPVRPGRPRKKQVSATYSYQRLVGNGQSIITDYTFAWPLEHGCFWLSSRFGPRRKVDRSWGFHYGIDMAAVKGTPIKAAGGGVVLRSAWVRGYGNCIEIAHNRKYKTRYAHLDRRHVEVGRKVTAGTVIGTVGETGFIRKKGRDGSHLHFEIIVLGKRVNPLYCLR